MDLFKRKKSRQEKIGDTGTEKTRSADMAYDSDDGDMLSSLGDMPITEHLIDLRRHLIKICVAVLVVFLALVGFSRELYNLLSDPLVAQLPANSTMIATDITSNFMAPIRLSIFVAAFVAMPYILYQIWSFVAPGLYKKEKKVAIPVLMSSIVLFYAGVAFSYFIVLKGVLKFFITFAPQNVLPMTDIDSYLSFALKLFMVFGLTFEIPVVTLLLILAGIVSIDSLEDKRRYIIVGCFAIAAVVTPPDGVSMLMLAFPMWLLFELGLFLAKILIKEERRPALANESQLDKK
ncbi:twin-arginine translocase subunit TatC [Psychrobacter celer]|uniref:twin-arginine translocase subunit TatC n=1 Tax=Psychrobacter TaxID=497 RepID=UPI000946C92C|nr:MULTISPECIES: twin-arginine translocase subunit TatC [unclassified Psychrobacter]MDN5734336.1 twin-arginine translocase subunit TatC [Psychrobacter sp.]OLF40518.1 twin arginine-targeting protein translocase TatC [Psychrobacter sp. Rd 27.2]PJX20863.1 twin-arginine translocase subunit TatC [Psychrobacter sp. L7]